MTKVVHSAQCTVHSPQFRSKDIARAFLCSVEIASLLTAFASRNDNR
ncbi:MAG: hypothetical protein LBL66_08215 [Clostridiales bacterium]|nr:hypothetical protein [Clostridiales bacterium]